MDFFTVDLFGEFHGTRLFVGAGFGLRILPFVRISWSTTDLDFVVYVLHFELVDVDVLLTGLHEGALSTGFIS
jgi:hypothetical protein